MGRNFSFIWFGLVHLEDGSQWRLADSGRQHDVTWWQTGEAVELKQKHGGLLLRNLARDEAVPVVAAGEGMLELAA